MVEEHQSYLMHHSAWNKKSTLQSHIPFKLRLRLRLLDSDLPRITSQPLWLRSQSQMEAVSAAQAAEHAVHTGTSVVISCDYVDAPSVQKEELVPVYVYEFIRE